jgi:hypothetical protein
MGWNRVAAMGEPPSGVRRSDRGQTGGDGGVQFLARSCLGPAQGLGLAETGVDGTQQRAATGRVAPKPRAGRRPMIGPDQADVLRAQIAQQADAPLAVHGRQWAHDQGVLVSVATMSRAVQRLAITRKISPPRQ